MKRFSLLHLPVFLITLTLSGCAFGSGKLYDPIPNARSRATPLSFGLYVTPDPENNPIDPPEEFAGFHTAVDYEVSAGEVDGDVPVYAICSGKVVYSGFADGYGGLVAERCTINREKVTVLYGHLALDTLPKLNARLNGGQTIGLLAAARTQGSGGNRKHLHLGIHRGETSEYRGYVQTEEELKEFIDPVTVLPSFAVDTPFEGPGEVPYWQEEVEE